MDIAIPIHITVLIHMTIETHIIIHITIQIIMVEIPVKWLKYIIFLIEGLIVRHSESLKVCGIEMQDGIISVQSHR